jgi:hypothetical protein
MPGVRRRSQISQQVDQTICLRHSGYLDFILAEMPIEMQEAWCIDLRVARELTDAKISVLHNLERHTTKGPHGKEPDIIMPWAETLICRTVEYFVRKHVWWIKDSTDTFRNQEVARR